MGNGKLQKPTACKCCIARSIGDKYRIGVPGTWRNNPSKATCLQLRKHLAPWKWKPYSLNISNTFNSELCSFFLRESAPVWTCNILQKSLEMFEIKRNENTNSIWGKVFRSVKVPCQEKVLQKPWVKGNTKEVNDVGEVNLQLCLVSLVSWEIYVVWWQVGMNPFDF